MTQAFEQFIALLTKWNRVYNLTAIREADMFSKHIQDALAISPFIQGNKILDVGSGAGLPGIPLAIQFPEKWVVLVESVGKKVRFLEAAKRELKLSNVEVVQSRVEFYETFPLFDVITCRAVTQINQLIDWTEHLLPQGGTWVVMKGQVPEDELISVRYPYSIHPYEVPGLVESRCVVCIQKT